VDLVDETFIAAQRSKVAAVVADPDSWGAWWPDLHLTVFMDRGLDGLRWSATGALTGSVEIWLEQSGDGVLLHYFLRADPSPGRAAESSQAPHPRHLRRLRQQRATEWKRQVWALKDALEGARLPGTPVDGGQR
jgi:hypothetical protein